MNFHNFVSFLSKEPFGLKLFSHFQTLCVGLDTRVLKRKSIGKMTSIFRYLILARFARYTLFVNAYGNKDDISTHRRVPAINADVSHGNWI